ncbi:RnfABCDGE type electron transport complex subunit D [Candidatus Methylospira mobilis]|uniref:RnfABCDGE type electron transport complex subunit D n=1 Tax=Candidatus Methylospira mobilis TaxID=1808979 RepID=UPI0028EEAF9F|nr:RnfABCDGE type electron transport complex subunit D [Candidatus Methylospira mobilis]WNV04407.1 RnfABCDGE type electron transport complex subunit D [Candidatus Methylospira mobilis]
MNLNILSRRLQTMKANTVNSIMLHVLIALTPATVFGVFIFGWPALFLFVVTVGSAALFEAICLKLSGKPVSPALKDGSALVTGWLLVMSLPPWAPWWIGVLGSALAIVVGKQVFGGLGQNIFNPAMVARVALLVSFPLEMTTWPKPGAIVFMSNPGFLESLGISFSGVAIPDAYTSATLLGAIKTGFTLGYTVKEALENSNIGWAGALFGWSTGSLGETSALLIGLGGAWLLIKRVITWHVPLSLLASVALLSTIFSSLDAEHYVGPLIHLTSGALLLVAFFIATDYVTSPSSPTGQIIFGAGCGALIYAIRTWGAFPEGAGFAVLLMNSLTPLLDHYFRPRIYGRDHRGRPLELPEKAE